VDDIARVAMIKGVVAARMICLRDLADRDDPAQDDPKALEAMMPPIYIQVVALLACVAAVNLTPRLFLLTVAKRGGYLGRKSDPRPGWKVLWRGMSDVEVMVEAIRLTQPGGVGMDLGKSEGRPGPTKSARRRGLGPSLVVRRAPLRVAANQKTWRGVAFL